MEKKLIAVVGATGAQGGSVVNYLLKSGEFRVRGLTRNKDSNRSKELAAKGVEMVQADLNNKSSLEAAFKGAWGVFGVTNYWDPDIYPNHKDRERTQGKLMVDVAKAQGVSFFVFSSLYNGNKISGGKIKIPHFSMKAEIEEYARSIADEKFRVAFFCPGFYGSNFMTFLKPQKTEEGWKLLYPVKSSTRFPLIDISESGMMVLEMFRNPEEWSGKRLLGAAEELDLNRIVDCMTKIGGTPVKYQQISCEEARKFLIPELEDNLKWMEEYGYYSKDSIDGTQKMFPKLTKFEDFLKKVQYQPGKELVSK